MQPWPIASTTWYPRADASREPARIIVHKTRVVDGRGRPGEVIEAAGDRLVIAAGEGAVQLLVIQLPGKKPASVAEFLHGHRIQPSDLLGPPLPHSGDVA
jgi:methionyl-tRNA formyltransferase